MRCRSNRPRVRRSEFKTDLSEMLLTFHIPKGLSYFGPLEDLIDNGLDGMQLNCAVHALQHRTRADINALHSDAVHEDRHRADARIAATESADDANHSSHA